VLIFVTPASTHAILLPMSDDIVTFRIHKLGLRNVAEVVVGVAISIFAITRMSTDGYVFAGLVIAALLYKLCIVPYEASIDSRNLVVFRSVFRAHKMHVEDVRKIRRRAGEGGVSWKFSSVNGSITLAGSPGERLAEHLCRLNPTIQLERGRLTKAERPEPHSVNAPEWVERGEKLSAQELARRQAEAERAFWEDQES
jgi:hypothetical protein